MQGRRFEKVGGWMGIVDMRGEGGGVKFTTRDRCIKDMVLNSTWEERQYLLHYNAQGNKRV